MVRYEQFLPNARPRIICKHANLYQSVILQLNEAGKKLVLTLLRSYAENVMINTLL